MRLYCEHTQRVFVDLLLDSDKKYSGNSTYYCMYSHSGVCKLFTVQCRLKRGSCHVAAQGLFSLFSFLISHFSFTLNLPDDIILLLLLLPLRPIPL